jgi:hypothetical protein
MFRSLLRTAFHSFLVGITVAVVLEFLWWMVGYYTPMGHFFLSLSLLFWPSSIFLMATDGHEDSTSLVAFFFAVSFIANGLLYAVIGLLFGAAKKLLDRA